MKLQEVPMTTITNPALRRGVAHRVWQFAFVRKRQNIIMKHLLFVCLFTALYSAVAHAVSAGASIEYHLTLSAGTGKYDGTRSTIWVRLYSENTSSWSRWNTVSSLGQGANKTLTFTMPAGFTDISRIEVYVGQNDGVRLTLDLDELDSPAPPGHRPPNPGGTWECFPMGAAAP